MTNLEKYADKIKNYGKYGGLCCDDIIEKHVLFPLGLCCSLISCNHCDRLTTLWLMEEYEEPEVDWSKVEVDTPILVRDRGNKEWNKRYFARYEYETIYAWGGGCTSWTAYDSDDVYAWKYAKLAEQEESDE